MPVHPALEWSVLQSCAVALSYRPSLDKNEAGAQIALPCKLPAGFARDRPSLFLSPSLSAKTL